MKKLISFLLTLLMSMILYLPAFGLAEEYLTLEELRGQAPMRWIQTYETKWRTLEVDAPIILPQAQKVPIVKIAKDLSKPLLTAGETDWQEVYLSESGSLILYNEEIKPPKKLDGKQLNRWWEPKEVLYGGYDPQAKYIPMSDLTFEDVCGFVEEELTRFGYDPTEYMFDQPSETSIAHMYYWGYKKDALPGSITMYFQQKLCGIPMMNHIWQAVHMDHYYENGLSDHELFDFFDRANIFSYNAYTQQRNHLFLDHWLPVEILAEDAPLCPIEKVLGTIEQEITNGHIRKLYEVELGYVLFNEPGQYVDGGVTLQDVHYYTKPMWRVNCLYVESATGKLRKMPDDVQGERNTLDYYQLLIDAQTGELARPSKEKTRCEFKGYISWEDVGGKQ